MVGLDNPLHIAIVVVVILLLFGAKRLPEIGKGLGEGLRGFKDSIQGQATEFKGSLEETQTGFKQSLHGEDTADEASSAATVTTPATVSTCRLPSRMLVFHEIAAPVPIVRCPRQVSDALQLMVVRSPISR